MASNYEPDEEDEDDEAENFETKRKLIDDVFSQSIGEIEYDLNTAKTARSHCRRFSPNNKVKLDVYEKRIAQLQHLLKNFENTASTVVEVGHFGPKAINETSKTTLSLSPLK